MLGNNLKVHFAGSEQLGLFEAALTAGVRYQLFTVFSFISEKFGIKGFPCVGVKDKELLLRLLKENIANQEHTIMDSGLFTLMFGAHAGKRDKAFIYRWADELAKFVNDNGIKATCVEVDCQKVLGVNEAWDMRHRMNGMLPNNRIINVFHMEDGAKGLDRIIEYSDYIAISVPEMRIVYGSGERYENAVIRLSNYIKNRKPRIDIHLLGCTSRRLLEQCRFCTTSDSTSWTGVNRFGGVTYNGEKHHVSSIRKDELEKIEQKLMIRFKERGISANRFDYYANVVCACRCLLQDYTRWAGDQT